MPKIIWKVQPAPTGRYRSFQNRGWPSAEYANQDFCASIVCEDDYRPADVKIGRHAPLKLRIRDYSKPEWKIVISKLEYSTLPEAKAALICLLEKFPHLVGNHE